MKNKLMTLLTTAALVMGLVACGGSVSTGDVGTSGSAVESSVASAADSTPVATPEPTPAVTPKPTATPGPVYTEVTLRDIQNLILSESPEKSYNIELIDGELPNTSLTMAEMYFHVPEGMTVTWEDINENREILIGISSDAFPGNDIWSTGILNSAIEYVIDGSKTDFAQNDNWTGDFNQGMSREEWESMFTLVREKYAIADEPEYWRNHAEFKDETLQALQEAVVELFNNYTYMEVNELLNNAGGSWDTVPEEFKKYRFISDMLSDGYVEYLENEEKQFEMYREDPSAWVDFDDLYEVSQSLAASKQYTDIYVLMWDAYNEILKTNAQ